MYISQSFFFYFFMLYYIISIKGALNHYWNVYGSCKSSHGTMANGCYNLSPGSVMATTTDPFYRIEVFVCRLVVIADQRQWCTCALSKQF